MPVLLRVEGPSLNRELLLDDGAAALTVGRDPAATLHLPDPERALSRRHLSIAAAGGGVRVTVLSSVNGATTSQGELAPGQTAQLAVGERVALGPYTIRIEPASGRAAPAVVGGVAPGVDDPFAALFGGAPGATGRGADPFDALGVPLGTAPVPAASDPFASLQPAPGPRPPARPGLAGEMHAFGHNLAHQAPAAHTSPTSADDPLSLLGGVGTGSASRVAVEGGALNIDDWLGAGAAPAPAAASRPGRLATDHVHDLNLPLQLPRGPLQPPPPAPADDPFAAAFGAPAPAAGVAPAAAPAAAAFAPPPADAADPWAAVLQSAWGEPAPAAPAAPMAHSPAALASSAGAARPSGAVAAPAAAPAAELDFDALFGGTPGADPFEDASWLGGAAKPGGAPSPAAAVPAASPQTPLPPAAAAAAPTPVPVVGPAPAGAGAPQAAAAFARGLGLPQAPVLDEAAWERVGGAVRLIVSGLIDLLNARAELKRELRVEDRTMLASRDNNPLKTGIDLESALHYLLINSAAMPGYKPPGAALQESIDELRVHELATVAASRSAVEGALRDFDPEVLRKQLAPGKSRLPQLFDSSRMWEAYVERYQKQGGQMADWLEKIFTRHFVPAYSKESERLKMTMAPPPGAGKAR